MRPIVLHGHTRPLTQIKYNAEGDLLFSVARDKSACVWFAHSGEQLGTYDGHNGAIYSVDTDATTRRLLTASADNSVRLWDVETGRTLLQIDHKTAARSVQYALGDRHFLVLTDARMGNPGMLIVYPASCDAASAMPPLQSIVMPGARATVARWGALNASIYTGHEDGSICQWDPVTGEKRNSVKAHDAPITDIQLATDKTYLISSSKDHTARIFDAVSLQQIKLYKTDRPLNSAALSPTHDYVIVGGGQEARDVTTTSARAGKFEVGFFHRIYADEIGRVKGHFGPVNTLAFHPSGKGFSSGGEDGYVRIHHFDDDYFDFNYEDHVE